MAKLIIKSGKRGRPLKIDPEEALNRFLDIETYASARVEWYKQTSKGVRFDSSSIGYKTLIATRDVLFALEEGQQINYETARQLKQNLNVIKRLASRQERVYSTAFSEILTKQYEQDVMQQSKTASKLGKAIYKKMLTTVKNMSKSQQTVFFTSSAYQDPKSNVVSGSPEISRAQAGVEDKTGERLGKQETLLYIEMDKLSRLETGKSIKERGISLEELGDQIY